MQIKEHRGNGTPMSKMARLFLFSSYPLKLGAVHLVVHELPCFLVSLDPETSFGVLNLAAFSNSSISVAVTGRRICSHKHELDACSFQAL